MFLARAYFDISTAKFRNQFLKAVQRPEEFKSILWRKTWQKCRETRFWKSRGSDVLDDFDLTTYADYSDALQENYQEPISRLTGEPIRYWIRSSATTSNRPKIFPLTDNYWDQVNDPLSVYISLLLRTFDSYMRQKIVHLTSPTLGQFAPSGIECGFLTRYIYSKRPKFVGGVYSIPRELLTDSALYEKFYLVYATAYDASALVTLTPARLAEFMKKIEASAFDILPFIEGKKHLPHDLPPLLVSRQRVQYLRTVLSEGSLTFKKLWPSLAFVRTMKTGTCQLQLKLLDSYISDGLQIVDQPYSASEGVFTVPVPGLNRTGGVLSSGSIIVEFLKVGLEFHRRNLIPAYELVEGEEYEVILTNRMGLIRYAIQDIVRCNGFFERSPILEFVRKSGAQLSLGGGIAIVTEEQISGAIQKLDMRNLGEWVFGPNRTGNGLILYCQREDLDASRIDNFIQDSNALYRKSIMSEKILPLSIKVVPRQNNLWNMQKHNQSKQRVIIHSLPSESDD